MASFYRLLCCMFLVCSTAAAQPQSTHGTIAGTVSDTGGTPTQGVTIRVVGTKRGAISRGNGSFVITALPAGMYTLHMTRIGYLPDTLIVTVRAGETTQAAVTLMGKALPPQEIIVGPPRYRPSPDVSMRGKPDVIRRTGLYPAPSLIRTGTIRIIRFENGERVP